MTVAPLRQMTSEPAINLSAAGAAAATPASDSGTSAITAHDESAEPESTAASVEAEQRAAANNEPARAIDVATADDASTLDPDLPINVRLRDAGAGLVVRVLAVNDGEKYAIVGAGAIESTFHVPFGWHVIDDGQRTLVFEPTLGVQISLNLRPATADALHALLESIGDELARDHPQALFLRLEILGMPCLAVRDIVIEGESLDQAYLARASHRPDLALVCRVTAERAQIEGAMNTTEVILRSLNTPSDNSG
jgi:hypothetical protein